MKVLMVLTYYHPHWTGLTAYAKRLAEGLAVRGHAVTVLTARYNPAMKVVDDVNGVRVVRLPVLGRLSRGVLMPGFPVAAWRLVSEADVVQLHAPVLESPLVALYGRMLNRPVIFTNHGDLVMPAGLFNQTVETVVTAAMTQALRLSTRLTTHSQDYADNSRFMRAFLEKTTAIYPPAEIPAPDRLAAAAWKESLGLGVKRLIGFAGRWVEEKGFDYLLQAVPHVLRQVPDAHFVYAGEPNVVYEHFFARCQPYLKPVQQHVTMLGLITDQQRLANFYAMCDVMAIPSRTDCFPSVQLEALACGTPLVTADIPGAREVVKVTGMGRIVPARNPEAMAEGLVEVLRAREAYVRPASAVSAVFDRERSIAEYEQLMAELVSEAHGRPRVLSGRTGSA